MVEGAGVEPDSKQSTINDAAMNGVRQLIVAVDDYRRMLAGREALTVSQMSTLAHLRACGGMGQTEIAHALGLTTSSTTAMLDRLERGGWVTRHPHSHDRRRTTVKLTVAGEAFLDRVRRDLTHAIGAIHQRDLATVTAALVHIANSLQTAAHSTSSDTRNPTVGL